jgi:hypothetical protein
MKLVVSSDLIKSVEDFFSLEILSLYQIKNINIHGKN